LSEFLSYDPETGHFTWIKQKNSRSLAGSRAGYEHRDRKKYTAYVVIRFDNQMMRASRLAWLFHYGVDTDMQVDHINLNGTDNRIENLRLATYSQNKANSRKPKSNNPYKGVRLKGKRVGWSAVIRCNNVVYKLGCFRTAEEAKAAYDAKAFELFGEFARVA
jgi:hypothetical protein